MKPSSLSSSNACRRLGPAVTTFVDGELDPSQVVEVESHVSECAACRERVALDRAVRASLRAMPRPSAPAALRERLAASLAAERAGGAAHEGGVEAAHEALEAPPPPRAPYRYMLPLTMAAGFALMLAAHKGSSPATAGRPAQAQAQAASVAPMGLDSLIEELVTQHAQPLPPEVTAQDDVRNFDPFVGVRVEPPKFANYGAKFYGGRMLPVREYRAAMLQYNMAGNHRVTVYVYDPRRVQPERRLLRERLGRNAPLYVGSVRGYNVAATERRGVGYAIASDLDEPESVELATAVPELP
jgi:anti-sigma factor RsiW